MTVAIPGFPAVTVFENVDATAFATNIFPLKKPAVLKGLVRSWPVVLAGIQGAEALMAYIQPFDCGQLTTVHEASASVKGRLFYSSDMRDFNFTRRQLPIMPTLSRLAELQFHDNPPTLYLQSTPTESHLPGFKNANPCPLLPSHIGPRVWIGNAVRTQTHNDDSHNLACVAAGHRRFILFPPEQLANLYLGPVDFTPSGRAISMASVEEPDFSRYPRFRDALAAATVADLEPGDALFIPKYWWHHVTSLSRINMLVNYWWGEQSNPFEQPANNFISALVSIKGLPPEEKAYWKAMFETYIFSNSDAAIAHIEMDKRGPLGDMTSSVRNKIIRTLLDQYRAGALGVL